MIEICQKLKKLKFFQKFQFRWHVWPIFVVKSNLSCLNGYFEGFWIEFSTHISSQRTFRAKKIHLANFRILAPRPTILHRTQNWRFEGGSKRFKNSNPTF